MKKCNCNYMSKKHQAILDKAIEMSKDTKVKSYLIDQLGVIYSETRTGHASLCPINTMTYNPGEFFGNCFASNFPTIVNEAGNIFEMGEKYSNTEDMKRLLRVGGGMIRGLYLKKS
jgi:hypothetical protein